MPPVLMMWKCLRLISALVFLCLALLFTAEGRASDPKLDTLVDDIKNEGRIQ